MKSAFTNNVRKITSCILAVMMMLSAAVIISANAPDGGGWLMSASAESIWPDPNYNPLEPTITQGEWKNYDYVNDEVLGQGTWKFNNGKMTIEGEGAYTSDCAAYQYDRLIDPSLITSVEYGEGITSIWEPYESYDIDYREHLEEVILPKTLWNFHEVPETFRDGDEVYGYDPNTGYIYNWSSDPILDDEGNPILIESTDDRVDVKHYYWTNLNCYFGQWTEDGIFTIQDSVNHIKVAPNPINGVGWDFSGIHTNNSVLGFYYDESAIRIQDAEDKEERAGRILGDGMGWPSGLFSEYQSKLSPRKLIIGNGIKEVGWWDFCLDNIKELDIPSTLEYLNPEKFFAETKNLNKFVVANGDIEERRNYYSVSDDGLLYYHEFGVWYDDENNTEWPWENHYIAKVPVDYAEKNAEAQGNIDEGVTGTLPDGTFLFAMPKYLLVEYSGYFPGSYCFANCSGINTVKMNGSFAMESAFVLAPDLTNIIVPEPESEEETKIKVEDSVVFSENISRGRYFLDPDNPEIPYVTDEEPDENANPYYEENENTLPYYHDYGVWGDSINFALPGISGDYVAPESVVSIEPHSFYGCTKLTSLDLSQSHIVYIPHHMCTGCTNLKSIMLPTHKLVSKNIPEAAFKGTGLESVVIPNNIKVIDSEAFKDCTSLESVVLPDGLTDIWYDAFSGCTSLKSITIPASVEWIADGAFADCKSLETVVFKTDETGNCGITQLNNVVFGGCENLKGIILQKNDGTALYEDGKNVIPASIGWIGNNSFGSCGLEHINFNKVTEIAEWAVENCPCLETIEMPNVQIIGESAFTNCALTEVTIPESCYEIGKNAFDNCKSLERVTWESNVDYINHWMFNECSSLKYFNDGSAGHEEDNFYLPHLRNIYEHAFQNTGFVGEINIPDGVEIIDAQAFGNCEEITGFYIPAATTEIDRFAFVNCDRNDNFTVAEGNPIYYSDNGILFSKEAANDENRDNDFNVDNFIITLVSYPCLRGGAYEIPDEVEVIGNSAFDGCKAITSLKIPEGIKGIGILAFAYNYSLDMINLPSTLEWIDEAAFCECYSLTDIYYYGDNWENVDINYNHAYPWDGTWNPENHNNDLLDGVNIHYMIGSTEGSEGYQAKIKEGTILDRESTEDVSLTVADASEAVASAAKTEIESLGGTVYDGTSADNFTTYDFSLKSGDNTVSVENGEVTVRIDNDNGEIGVRNEFSLHPVAVYHTKADGSVEQLETTMDEYGVSFTTTGFSPITVVRGKPEDVFGFHANAKTSGNIVEAMYDKLDNVMDHRVALIEKEYYDKYTMISPEDFVNNNNTIVLSESKGTLTKKGNKYNSADLSELGGEGTYYAIPYVVLNNNQYVMNDPSDKEAYDKQTDYYIMYEPSVLLEIANSEVTNPEEGEVFVVSFESNGSGDFLEQNVAKGDKVEEPAAPTKEGFEFAGWYSDPELTIAWDFDNDIVSEDITLYAKWEESGTNDSDVSGFVTKLYSVVLGREPEAEGLNYWTDLLKSRVTNGADVAYGFFFSEEYLSKNKSDEEYVLDLYATFMGREPGQDEVDYWVGILSNGATREDVYTGFTYSDEWKYICYDYNITPNVDAPLAMDRVEGVSAFARRLYTCCLGREAEEEGLEYWANLLLSRQATGTNAAYGFFFSGEFVNANYSDREYIIRLYKTLMNREPDEEELGYWCGELSAGATREDIFTGFASSQEFKNICDNYCIRV